MIIEESYIQYTNGFIKRDVVPEDIKKAIKYLQSTDQNDSAFWVGVYEQSDDEVVMETTQDQQILVDFGTGESVRVLKANDWTVVIDLYDHLLKGEINELRSRM